MLAGDYLGERVEQVSAAELAERLGAGRVVLLDVRPEVQYRAGHITGARSAPLEELPAVAESLPKHGEVVAYCRGPYCVFADDAVRLLARSGFVRGGWMWASRRGCLVDDRGDEDRARRSAAARAGGRAGRSSPATAGPRSPRG